MRLKNVADVLPAKDIAAGLAQLGDVDRRGSRAGRAISAEIEDDASAVGREDSRDQVQERGLSRSTAANEAELRSPLPRWNSATSMTGTAAPSGATYCFFRSRRSTDIWETIHQLMVGLVTQLHEAKKGGPGVTRNFGEIGRTDILVCPSLRVWGIPAPPSGLEWFGGTGMSPTHHSKQTRMSVPPRP